MKKELAIALPLAFGAPFAAAGTCRTTASTGGDGTTVTCTTGNLDNISGPVELQASAGVVLAAQDGGGNDIGSNDIVVSTCHQQGSAAYYGDTGGGSMQKNADFGTGNCPNDGSFGYTSATSGGTL